MFSEERAEKIRRAYLKGKLTTRSVSPEGVVEWRRVVKADRSEVPWEAIFEGETEKGLFTLTAGHRVFTSPTEKVECKDLKDCAPLSVFELEDSGAVGTSVLSLREVESRQFMYDMTVEGWHNFVLERSGLVVSNSPDRNYRFVPPEHEGRINKFNRVFGQIWEDEELRQYLIWALYEWNSFAPATPGLCSLDQLIRAYPQWTTFILWGAAAHALFALSVNWIHDEFSVTGDTLITVLLPDGRELDVPIEDLYQLFVESQDLS